MRQQLSLLIIIFFCHHTLTAQISPGDLVINEIVAANDSIIADQNGEYDDWIELYNNSANSLNLSGLYMTDDPAVPTKWAMPDTILPVDSYLIVWADNDSFQTGLHAHFRLAGAGEFLWMGYINGSVVDSLTFGPQAQDLSYGRFPNGTGNFELMPPTFSSVNMQFGSSIDTLQAGSIVINEFMGENDATISDQNGEFEDWVEIYNTTSDKVSLANIFLSDNIAFPGKWAFPDTVIAANGYLMVWADEDASQPGLHANFRISNNGEELFLGYADGTVIDSLSFGVQIADTTYGRFPNGDGPFGRMLPTFSAENSGFIVATGIEKAFPGIDIRLFPNPASHIVFFEASHPVRTQLSLFTAYGSIVHRQLINNQTFSHIDISHLNEGIYLIRLGEKAYGKLLITR